MIPLVGAKEEIGRGLVKLQPAVKIEPQPLTQWYHLGDGDWGAAEGCGKGCGRIQLRMQYRSFHNFQVNEPRDAEVSQLVITSCFSDGREWSTLTL